MNSQPKIIDKRTESLFVHLAAIYGHIWWNIYKNESLLTLTKTEWNEGLKRYENRVLKEALLYFRDQKGYPPTLPQFIECCKNIAKRNAPCSFKPQPFQPADPSISKQYIEAMLKKLKS